MVNDDCYTEDFITPEFSFVIFGGAGDLSKKKLIPTLFHLFEQNQLPQNFTIIGCGSPVGMESNQYRELAQTILQEENEDTYSEEKFSSFAKHLYFLSSRFENDEVFENLDKLLKNVSPKDENGKIKVIYYMAIPPVIVETIIEKLNKFNMNSGLYEPKIIVEKPFGHDYESSHQLNKYITSVFKENEIYRIDHYLGKETLQNIMFFRFSNSIFEPLWNSHYIDNVQITVAEDLGIENRGNFYEKACVVRDIVQNHVMQIIALIAMEPPVGFDPEMIRDEKVKVFRSINIMDSQTVADSTVRGQYGEGMVYGNKVNGYRSENFVAPNSNTATFFAGIFRINNWRWAGVPFYVRTGKRLSKRITEIVIEFNQPPLQLFKNECEKLKPSALILTIQPEESITLKFGVKYPNTTKRISPIKLNFSYSDEFNEKSFPPYSRLILDCLKGDLTLFVRQDEVEATWQIIDPIINEWENSPCPEYPNYSAGSNGPELSDKLLTKDGKEWVTKLT